MSLHLVEHDWRAIPRLWRGRDDLIAEIMRTPSVAMARLGPAVALHAATGGTPYLRRSALVVGWHERAARDAFLADPTHPVWPGEVGTPAGVRQGWVAGLDTVRIVRGDWHGWVPETDGAPRLDAKEPMAVLTLGTIGARSLPTFFRGNRKVCRAMDADPAAAFRVGTIDGPLGFLTFSLWRSQPSMTHLAYRSQPHEGLRRRFNADGRIRGHFFARFRPVASRGTWSGRDPLADLRSAR